MADDSESTQQQPQPQQAVEMEQRPPPPQQTTPSSPTAQQTPQIPPTQTMSSEAAPPIRAEAPTADNNDVDEVTAPAGGGGGGAVIQEQEAKSGTATDAFAPISITLLSSSSGARTNMLLNSEYLLRHNLEVSDPLAMSTYNLKECIWRDWNEENMDKRPTGAHLIRLIFFGRLLEDRSALRNFRFSSDAVNVIHLSVKPSESGNEDDATTKSGKGFGATLGMGRRSGSPTCRCIIL